MDAAPDLLPAIRSAYGSAAAAWRMPMHGGFDSIRAIQDIPYVARHPRADLSIADVRRLLGLPVDVRVALASFGGYGLGTLPLDRLDCLPEWQVAVTGPRAFADPLPQGVVGVSEAAMYEAGLRYEDLVRAVDAVVTKPGYGIVSDCVANDTPMLYTSRGRFAEYDVMVAEMPRVLRCRFLDLESLLAGRWKTALDAVAAAPGPPVRPRTDGAAVVTRLILAPSHSWRFA
jgi:L-arabinokinase